jgi:hypothetical protein
MVQAHFMVGGDGTPTKIYIKSQLSKPVPAKLCHEQKDRWIWKE